MAVLNAADPIVAAMAENTRGDVTFFAQDGSLPIMQKHRAQGRRIVYVDDGFLVAAQGKRTRTHRRWRKCRSPAAA
jgi:cyanophycin synthetase